MTDCTLVNVGEYLSTRTHSVQFGEKPSSNRQAGTVNVRLYTGCTLFNVGTYWTILANLVNY